MPSSSRLSRWVNRVLAGGTDIREGEGRSVLAAGLLFFLLLTASMILRPVREALGLERGIEVVRQLFFLTLAATILLAPLFGWLVSRVPRRMLLSVSFRICAVILVGFYAALTFFPDTLRDAVSPVYYVFHSVFNLFIASLFWAFMADLFRVSESKRLFPPIAIGGSLGAIFGSLISLRLAESVGVGSLFLLAAIFLELAVWAAVVVTRTRLPLANGQNITQPIGGHLLAGVTALIRSPYILGIAAFVALAGVMSTFLYFTQLRLVEKAGQTVEDRTVLFANINVWIQVATLTAQAVVTGRIMRFAGVASALAVLPCVAACGFAVLAARPTLFVYTLVGAAVKAAQVGVTRPARETLFTVLDREQKYKAKSFIDTFCYRAGDATGAQIELALAALGPGLLPLALSVVPLTAVWVVLSGFLGRSQSRLAGDHGKTKVVSP
jgi:AAA family ATP:ADP antiporter